MLKSFDIFGTVFNFTINKQRLFKTSFGGFLSIFSVLMSLLISFLFGQDFYYKTNPRVLLQKSFLSDHQIRYISNKNLTIAWRIEDYAGNKLEHKGIFYPKLNFLSYSVDSKQNNKMVLKKQVTVNITKCSETKDVDKHLADSADLQQWYCLDFSSIQAYFGGYWNSEFIYFYRLSLETCEAEVNSEKTEIKKPKCANLTQLNEFINQDVYLSLMLPQVALYYDNLNEPFQIVYRNSFTSLDLRLSRSQHCDFEQVTLEDDQGIIFKTNSQSTSLSLISPCELSGHFKGKEEYIEGKNVVFFSTEFYLRMSFVFSQRSFMKIQEFAAIMGGFFNIVYNLAVMLNWFNNLFERDMLLINANFKFNKNEDDFKNKFAVFKIMNKELYKKVEEEENKNFSGAVNEFDCYDKNNNNYKNNNYNYFKNVKVDNSENISLENSLIFINSESESNNENKANNAKNHCINSFDRENCHAAGNYFEMQNVNKNKINIKNHIKIPDGELIKKISYIRDDLNDSNNLNYFKEIKITNNLKQEINSNNNYNNFNIQNQNRSKNKNLNESIKKKNLMHENNKFMLNNSDNFKIKKNENINEIRVKRHSELLNQHSTNTLHHNTNNNKTLQNISGFDPKEALHDKIIENLITSPPKSNQSKNSENLNLRKDYSNLNLEKNNKCEDLSGSLNKNNIYKSNNNFNVREIIQNSNSKDFFYGISFFDYLCPSLCIRKNKKQEEKLRILKEFKNGKFHLDKKLDLFKYLDNLYLLKLISKFILNKHQRFYFKNSYKYLINNEERKTNNSMSFQKIEKKNLMIQYIEKILEKNFEDISKNDKLIIENVFNQ